MGIITYNNVKSTVLNIEVSSPPRLIMPEEDADFFHMNGISGDRARRWGSYKNVNLSYPISIVLDDGSYLYGDVNLDGHVTASDASLILRYLSGLETFTDLQKKLADVDRDGEVTSNDAELVLRSVVRLIEPPGSYYSKLPYIESAITRWLHPYYTKYEIDRHQINYLLTGDFRLNKEGYFKLTDTYDPYVFRKALCVTGHDFLNVYDRGLAGTIQFAAMPQRFYNDGEIWSSGERIGDNTMYRSFYNYSGYPSWPIIKIHFDSTSHSESARCRIIIDNIYDINGSVRYVGGNVYYDSLLNPTYHETKYIILDPNIGYQNALVDLETGETYGFDDNENDLHSVNNKMLTKINRKSGLFTAGYNKVAVRLIDGNQTTDCQFSIRPRWWTL